MEPNPPSRAQKMGSALSEWARERTGTIGYIDNRKKLWRGTVNFLRRKKVLYAVTCEHISRDVKISPRVTIATPGNLQFRDSAVSVIAEDPQNDIGLLQIEASDDILELVPAYSIENINPIADFAIHNFVDNDFFLYGYPGGYQTVSLTNNHYSITAEGMAYFCGLSATQASNEHELVLDYDTGEGMVLISAPEDRLPRAPGISGCFVSMIPHPESEAAKTWTPASASVIAIQKEWDEGRSIYCANVKHLLSLIP